MVKRKHIICLCKSISKRRKRMLIGRNCECQDAPGKVKSYVTLQLLKGRLGEYKVI